MSSTDGLERLGYVLAGATAVVTLIAFLMVRDHIEARDLAAPGALAASAATATR
jgi:hypothetical protein